MTHSTEAILDRYGAAWNLHDVDAILAMHADDAVFQNHTSGGIAVGKLQIRQLLDSVFDTFPDLHFATRRAYFGAGVGVVEWTATATHSKPIARGTQTFPPTGKTLAWDGMDIMPIENGLIARKDVYADSISFLRQLGVALP